MAEPCPQSATSVSVINRCPMNSSEWNQRAIQKNCSMYPQTCRKPLQYHCLLNPYGNESIEVCAPDTLLDRGEYDGCVDVGRICWDSFTMEFHLYSK